MKIIIEELTKSQRYHKRQMEDNLQQIKNKEESIEILKVANEKHVAAISEIDNYIGKLQEHGKDGR
ncbi:hypothetical protein [Niallia sp. FSL R7-0271]|uniref:hypothetical protein n=1 Tax=Niallia sp. FSL R7-0271 TaxID=2921678 RepID=UPI0030FC6B27